MKLLTFVIFLTTVSQSAHALYLIDASGKQFGPYTGNCANYGKATNFKCSDAPAKMAAPMKIQAHEAVGVSRETRDGPRMNLSE